MSATSADNVASTGSARCIGITFASSFPKIDSAARRGLSCGGATDEREEGRVLGRAESTRNSRPLCWSVRGQFSRVTVNGGDR
jgi:hypothetical protein